MKSKAMECNKGCGTDIYFDDARKSESGKKIPIECDTNEPHNCPNSDYNTGKTTKSISERLADLEHRVSELEDKT